MNSLITKTITIIALVALALIPLNLGKVGYAANERDHLFYQLGDNIVEFLVVSDSESKGTKKLPTIDGEYINVFESSTINAHDIDGLTLNVNALGVYLKKDAWLKFLLYTRNNRNKEIALVINDLVVYSATVTEYITTNITYSLFDEKYEILDNILSNFIKTDIPDYLFDINVYIDFLKDHERLFPNDISYTAEIVSSYTVKLKQINDDPKAIISTCLDAIPYMEKVYNSNPVLKNTYNYLGDCYIVTSNYEHAIELFDRMLPWQQPENRWYMLQRLGVAHLGSNSFDQALLNFNEALSSLKQYNYISKTAHNIDVDITIAKFLFKNEIDKEKLDSFETIDEIENYLKNESIKLLMSLIDQTSKEIDKGRTNP